MSTTIKLFLNYFYAANYVLSFRNWIWSHVSLRLRDDWSLLREAQGACNGNSIVRIRCWHLRLRTIIRRTPGPVWLERIDVDHCGHHTQWGCLWCNIQPIRKQINRIKQRPEETQTDGLEFVEESPIHGLQFFIIPLSIRWVHIRLTETPVNHKALSHVCQVLEVFEVTLVS